MTRARRPRSVNDLRAHALAQSLFQTKRLQAAIDRLGFVQADPIRAPARAQDLILWQRVADYRAGDLERRYAALDIEEDFLYAYGFVSRSVFDLLHPRRPAKLSLLERRVLAAIERLGPTHPSALAAEFGTARVVNAWGGYSKATKHALERLHYRGLLRVARRESGIRVYEVAPAAEGVLPVVERFRTLVLWVARILAPVVERTLLASVAPLRRTLGRVADTRRVVQDLVECGELERQAVDGVNYLWPAAGERRDELERRVRFLAPFDPVVWDRRRFEHLFGWAYRFEAYTPAARRVRGYYALPLLWADRVIGWVNARLSAGSLELELGFVERRPAERTFELELERETARLAEFLSERPRPSPLPRR